MNDVYDFDDMEDEDLERHVSNDGKEKRTMTRSDKVRTSSNEDISTRNMKKQDKIY